MANEFEFDTVTTKDGSWVFQLLIIEERIHFEG